MSSPGGGELYCIYSGCCSRVDEFHRPALGDLLDILHVEIVLDIDHVRLASWGPDHPMVTHDYRVHLKHPPIRYFAPVPPRAYLTWKSFFCILSRYSTRTASTSCIACFIRSPSGS